VRCTLRSRQCMLSVLQLFAAAMVRAAECKLDGIYHQDLDRALRAALMANVM
jgi:hypothetical protein